MVTVRLAHKDMEAKPDYDGEMREMDVDAVLELDIKPLELGKPACEERLKNDCGCSGSGCCCKNRGPQNTPGNGT